MEEGQEDAKEEDLLLEEGEGVEVGWEGGKEQMMDVGWSEER